jgi:hypothetical protein
MQVVGNASVPSAPRTLPLVLGPADIGRSSAAKPDLVAWICENRRHWQHELLYNDGAILFRGFAGMATPDDFVDVAMAVSPNLMEYVGGTSPRLPVKGRIATSTEAPPRAVVPQHQEMSYTFPFPDKLMFFCEVAPPVGGQTPLADMRNVTAKLPMGLMAEFERRGLRLVRELSRQSRRVGRKVWPDVFGTTDRDVIERMAVARGWTVEWLAGDKIRLTQEVRPATISHPHTGDRVWFNEAHMFCRSPVHNLGRWLAGLIYPDRGKGDYVFGDGAAIPFTSLARIREAIREETRTFDWQVGDVLLIDNILVSHGRRSFKGSRRILAALLRDAL